MPLNHIQHPNKNSNRKSGGSEVKNLSAKQEVWVRSLGEEDPLEKEMATHSSTLAWEIPWMDTGPAPNQPRDHHLLSRTIIASAA